MAGTPETTAADESNDPYVALLAVALEVATWPPAKQPPFTHTAQVAWSQVHRLRDALRAIGVQVDDHQVRNRASRGLRP